MSHPERAMGATTEAVESSTKAVLYVDIVDFSLRQSSEQVDAVMALIEMLHLAIPKGKDNPAHRLWSPAGDGGCLTFSSPELALETVGALARSVSQYNAGSLVARNGKTYPSPSRRFELRTGLHSGPVIMHIDFDERVNAWGDGINTAARIAAIAHPNQILVSDDFYRQAELSQHDVDKGTHGRKGERTVVSVGRWWVKHNKSIGVCNYSVEGEAGVSCADVEPWYGPFQYPLEMAIRTYQSMAEELTATGPAFRAAVIAKRILDLDPQSQRAKDIIASISETRFPTRIASTPRLYNKFFSRLSPSALIYFFSNAKFQVFQPESVICREGDTADSMLFVVSGNIIPTVAGERIRVLMPENGTGDHEIVFEEGDIIGEMGLFSEGETRTATLSTPEKKPSVVLALDYRFLRGTDVETGMNTEYAREIRDQVWVYYQERMIENTISSHRLLQVLTDSDRDRLRYTAKLKTSRYEDRTLITLADAWDNMLIIVRGKVIVVSKAGRVLEYRRGDCLGPLRLVVEGVESPYTNVEAAQDTHVVQLPWKEVDEITRRNVPFLNALAVEGIRARRLLLGA
jgi:class 3 adenylate cyclase/CRP-like cAMP-binding protein